jgi:hypothetical protein
MDLQPKFWKSWRLQRAFFQNDPDTVSRLIHFFTRDELRTMSGERPFELRAMLDSNWPMVDAVYPEPEGTMEADLSRWVGWYSSTASRPNLAGMAVLCGVLDRWTDKFGLDTLSNVTVRTTYRGTYALEEEPPASWAPRPFGERMSMDHPGFMEVWQARSLARTLPGAGDSTPPSRKVRL